MGRQDCGKIGVRGQRHGFDTSRVNDHDSVVPENFDVEQMSSVRSLFSEAQVSRNTGQTSHHREILVIPSLVDTSILIIDFS